MKAIFPGEGDAIDRRLGIDVKSGLVPGCVAEVEFEVVESMCPAFDGQVVHPVCSTWILVHYMELASRRVLIPHLEPDEEGVGSHVSCDHLGPAAIGSHVRVVATVHTVGKRELTCQTEAYRAGRLIATGRTIQKIFPRQVLARILQRE